MPIAGVQYQAPIVLQAYTSLDARTSGPSRAYRNAIEQKFDRMVFVITEGPDRGTICTLKPVPSGYTLVTWGQQNEHWDEEAPIDGPLDPGGGTGGNGEPLYDVPWQDAYNAVFGLNGQPPLTSGDLIRIVQRPTDGATVDTPPNDLQDGEINQYVFGGDIIILVTDPSALELTGRRVRTNPLTSEVETETVRYDLVSDRILRVYDRRGNDVRGDAGLAAFPFFQDWITGNVVDGALTFYDSDDPELTGDIYDAHDVNESVVTTIRNNHVEVGATLRISRTYSQINYDVSGNQISNAAVVQVDNITPSQHDINFTANKVSAYLRLHTFFWALTLVNCQIADAIDFSLINDGATFELTNINGGELTATTVSFASRILTPTTSTFEATAVFPNDATLDVTRLNWLGVLNVRTAGITSIELQTIVGLAPRRSMILATPTPAEDNEMETIVFVHNLPLLNGFNGADTTLHVPVSERVTVLRRVPAAEDAPDANYTDIVAYEDHTAEPPPDMGGHVIIDGNNEVTLPQQPNLVFQGDVTVTNDGPNNATVVTYNGTPGAEGKGYQTTSSTANTISVANKTFVCDTPAARLAYTVGARVRASSVADPVGKYMEGVVTAATVVSDVLTLLVAVDHVVGLTGAAISAWNLNVAGEKPLYREGQVDYAAGSVTLRLETGGLFEIDLNTVALGVGTAVTLNYTGAATGKSVLIRVKQKLAAPFRTLSYAANKFSTTYAWPVPLTQSAGAFDQFTGLFHKLAVGSLMSLVYSPNVLPI